MKFYEIAGPAALGSRLRRLGDVFLSESEKLYEHYQVAIDPRWFPVVFMLQEKGHAAITELAEDIGQTHPAVSQVVSSMMKAGIVDTQKSPEDGRVKLVALTDKGKAIAANLKIQCRDVEQAVATLFADIGSQLWLELDAVEQALESQSFYRRVMAEKKLHAQQHVRLVPYEQKYQAAYRSLNMAWIEKHFKMEASDFKALDSPQQSILDQGGYIVIALLEEEPVGTCVLIKMDNQCFELAKMTVAEQCRGMGVGQMLGEHCIAKAKAMGAHKLYLESNTVLDSAINLYLKLGFKRISAGSSPYSRCNIQMELEC
ncbi:hypothetical protein TDB9533_00654 [Thalassocella blandensis]|nr:hypothetical protein TDB9533_00654 [Thalassocella blandensis]